MKSQAKINSYKLNLKWDIGAKEKLDNSQIKMNFEEYIEFIEQIKPTEDELRKVTIFKTKFTL